MTTAHQQYMLKALKLAELGRLTVSPNPMVGCVLVKNDRIIAEGYHHQAGSDHAEIAALKNAREKTQDAVAYVTLEPCCHFGKTPPCTSALINAGIKKVYIAIQDPNSLVNGKGVDSLRQAGITVEIGLCEKEARQLNEIFFHFITTKKPFVIAKWAMSLDGKTITNLNDSPNISSDTSRKHTHRTRQQVDAIIIGSNTAVLDDPLLTVRLEDTNPNKQPLRIILSSSGFIPKYLKVFDKSLPGKTIVATTKHKVDDDIEYLVVEKNSAGRVHLPHLLELLGKRNITSVLVEGGMTVHESFFTENLVNRVQVYLAPVIIGKLPAKKELDSLQHSMIFRDYYFSGDINV